MSFLRFASDLYAILAQNVCISWIQFYRVIQTDMCALAYCFWKFAPLRCNKQLHTCLTELLVKLNAHNGIVLLGVIWRRLSRTRSSASGCVRWSRVRGPPRLGLCLIFLCTVTKLLNPSKHVTRVNNRIAIHIFKCCMHFYGQTSLFCQKLNHRCLF